MINCRREAFKADFLYISGYSAVHWQTTRYRNGLYLSQPTVAETLFLILETLFLKKTIGKLFEQNTIYFQSQGSDEKLSIREI